MTADEARSSVKVLSIHRGRRVHSYNSCRFEYLSIGNSKVMQRLRHGQPEGSRENMRRGEKEEPRQAEISRLGTETNVSSSATLGSESHSRRMVDLLSCSCHFFECP